MEKYGITKTTRYALVNKHWKKTDEWTDCHAIISVKHWEEWLHFFLDSGASLTTNNGRMIKFTSYAPNQKEKAVTELLSDNYELSTFDRLDNITDRAYNALYRKAKKACERKGVNFKEEQAFISSSDLHGFYFPNNAEYRGVFFIKGNAVLMRDGLLD